MRTFPVARQGAALAMKVATGALKGLMAAQTPRGSWRTSFTKPRAWRQHGVPQRMRLRRETILLQRRKQNHPMNGRIPTIISRQIIPLQLIRPPGIIPNPILDVILLPCRNQTNSIPRRETIQCQNRNQGVLHEHCETVETFCALESGEFRVRVECGFGVGDGGVDVGGRGDGDGVDDESVVLGVVEGVGFCAGGGGGVGAVEVDFVGVVGRVKGS
jgi:hypothetical protein